MIVVVRNDVPNVPVWFDAGEKLPVLSIMIMPSGGPKYLLWSTKQSSVGLFPTVEFDVLDPALPQLWIAKTGLSGQVELSPREWQVDGFWERYHDEDPEALRLFRGCYEILVGESIH